MKLSLSLHSKLPNQNPNPQPSITFEDNNPNPNDAASIQYVTEFDATKPTRSDAEPRVIPPTPNEWLKKTESDNRIDVASVTAKISDGLNLWPKREPENWGGEERPRSESAKEVLAAEKLKYDLERLPEHCGVEEYEEMSLEEFGPALLAGYGWRPGVGIGKNAKEDVRAKEYTKSTGRQGLGFHTNSKEKERNNFHLGPVDEE